MTLIPVTKPSFAGDEESLVAAVLQSGWVTQGPQVAAFERRLAEFVGARHVVAVTSCTTALQLVLHAHGIGPGDEVIVPSHTYIATVNAVALAGATPVLVDVRADTATIDPDAIEAAITERTRAVMPVNLGLAADLDEIDAIARRHGLVVLEDGAQGFGAAYGGRMIGEARHAVCFSFHPRKVITTGEGGAIATDDDALAAELRLLRHHYISVPDTVRHGASRVVVEEYTGIGVNARMSDVHAAIGVAQMERVDWMLARRRHFAARYDRFLRTELGWLAGPSCPRDRTHSYVSYVARLAADAPIARDDLMQALLERGIASRPGIMCVHQQPAYRDRFNGVSLPVSEAITERSIILPLYPDMNLDEHDTVCAALRDIAPAARQLRGAA